MFSLIPWRWALGGFVVVALVAALLGWLDNYGRAHAAAGRAEVQAAVDIKTTQANAAARESERIHTELINDISTTYETRIAAAGRAAELAVSAGDRLRKQIRATAAPTVPAAQSCQPSSGPDGRTEALGGLLATCSRLAENSSADSERLAEQLRGLQSYALAVSADPAPPISKE